MKLRALIIVPALVMTLAGCQTAVQLLTGQTKNPLTPQYALAVHAGYDAGVVVAAGKYAGLPRCPAPQPCSDQAVVNKLRVYVNAGETALNNLDQWALNNPRLDGPALFAIAIGAVTTAQKYALEYGLSFTPAPGT